MYDNGRESLALLLEIQLQLKEMSVLKDIHSHVKRTEEMIMALSAKMQEFVDASQSAFNAAADSLANISEDIKRLQASSTGLSEEDKAALDGVTLQLNNLKDNLAQAAAIVPEP